MNEDRVITKFLELFKGNLDYVEKINNAFKHYQLCRLSFGEGWDQSDEKIEAENAFFESCEQAKKERA